MKNNKVKKGSELGKLEKRQWFKGLLLAVLTGVLGVVKSSLLNAQGVDIKEAGVYAAIGAVTYIGASLGENSEGKILKKEPNEATK